ncbi:hypothetical protein [Stomatohabitans albus]|uniref:shikimate dehydrogenase family protein n=1 Tax=Stomatohabitans albus TaxID=3110766 RepID=UPI00300C1CDC
MTTAQTRLTGLVGFPVAHSLSPVIHSAAIEAAGVDAVYLAFSVPPDRIELALEGLVAIGMWGLNVTIPHKGVVLSFADAQTEEARGVGAANTLFWDNGQLWADNTDAIGLQTVLTQLRVQAEDWVEIIGAGGAARAAAVAAGRLGAMVTCVARRPDRAKAIMQLACLFGGQPPTKHGKPRVVINATPLGRNGESLDAEYMGLGPGRIALDLNYEGNSPFLITARDSGGKAVDGTGMLVAQAEAAFERWFTHQPPPGVMQRALGRK